MQLYGSFHVNQPIQKSSPMKKMFVRFVRATAPKFTALIIFTANFLLGQRAQATVYLTEPFGYSAGTLGLSPANGGWDTTVKSAITVAAPTLTAPIGFPAVSGNGIVVSSSGHNQSNYNAFVASGTINSGTVYACFLLKMNSSGSMPSSGNAQIFSLCAQDSPTEAVAIHTINSSGIKLGLSKAGGTAIYGTTALGTTATYIMVMKYDFTTSPNTASVWMLSTYQSSEAGAGAPYVTINSGADFSSGTGIGRAYVRNVGGGTFQLDELRIGSTWQEVVASAAGAAAKLAFIPQPAGAAPGATMNPLVVQLQDAGGLSVASNNVPVTLTLSSGTGTLSGTTTQNSDATGKATFSDLSLDLAGVKQLTATASGIGAGLSSAVSSNFTIAVPSFASKLAFTTQPTDRLTNAAFTVVVQAQDANSVNVTTNGVAVTLTLTTGTGALAGTTTQNTDATGKATFANLSLNTAGTGKQLTAAAANLTSALSSTFAITNSTGGGTTNPVSTNGPVITQILYTPTGIVLIGTNGLANSNFNVIASSDVATANSNWVAGTYANYDANGNFSITNPNSTILADQFFKIVTTVNTKLTPPSITQPPVNLTVAAGQTATFTVVAGGPQLVYQWFFAGNLLPGQRAATLTINNAQAGNVGNYYVVVANGAGAATSSTATLRVGNFAPTIVSPPSGQTNYVGGKAVFHVVADGTQPLTYQWFHNNSGSPVASATNSTLTLSNLALGDAGTYFIVVSGAVAPAATSTSAPLVVNNAPTALPPTNMVGFAAVANVTGGAAGSNIYVGDYASLSNAVRRTEPLMIYITNLILAPSPAIDPYLQVLGNNKSFIGVGTNAGLAGGDIKINATNIIIQNLSLPVPPGGTNDGITIDSGKFPAGKFVWIDHCTISNAQDGSIDITKGADYVTVSWCKFIYAPKTPAFTHELVNLIGSSDTDFVNNNPFHITFHHNWYADNAIERMPSVRHGIVHVFNNYYTCSGNNYCVRTRLGSQVLVENNYFSGVQNPWELLTTSGTTGLLKATGNNVTGPGDTSAGNSWLAGWYAGQSLIPGTNTLPDLNPPVPWLK